jgi:hypothetical protein
MKINIFACSCSYSIAEALTSLINVKVVFITIKLANTKENTNEISLVYCGDIYRLNFSLLNPSVNTDMNIPTVYTEGSQWKKKK